ncbi:NRDE family protein [Nocardia sp. NPDC005978]|uniref:NRDE family protein n=1 Tax=Nocardia sp. NPDC005978 TaxID=3156725 RepID=UPI0033BE2E3F
MCLVLLGWRAHPEYRLIVAANRDEFYTRPTESLRWWDEVPGLLAGRDRGAAGPLPGTWLGMDRDSHRFAAVTNVRGPNERRPDARSRGALMMDFLSGDADSEKFARAVASAPDEYNGFNLVVSDLNTLWWQGNRSGLGPKELTPGFHGLSNGALAASLTPENDLLTAGVAPVWPKVRSGVRGLHEVVTANPGDTEAYLTLLADRTRAADDELPDTGLGLRGERINSSRFIASPLHGTRCSTVLLVREDGGFEMTERSYGRFGRRVGTASFRGRLELPA